MLEEVYLWRGSPEQRALRDRCVKTGQFAYFDRQLGSPDWSNKLVLDFGGNAGNLMLDAGCPIRQENYYCIDVVSEALAEGRQRFPRAHWVHYDRFNCSFHPQGRADELVPDLGVNFDVILAYSVFTHTTREEMHDLVRQLQKRLAPGGVLAFTFIDPHVRPWPDSYDGNNLQWRLEKAREMNPIVDVDGLLKRSRGAKWCALVDGTELFIERNGSWDSNDGTQCITYNVFYTADFLQREFPLATILPPVSGEMQHCCVIRANASTS